MMNMYYFYNKEKSLKNKEATEEKREIFKYEGLLIQKKEVLRYLRVGGFPGDLTNPFIWVSYATSRDWQSFLKAGYHSFSQHVELTLNIFPNPSFKPYLLFS